MAKKINVKRLEKYEQIICNSMQPNVDLLLGSKSATEGLMCSISNIKANLIDYSRVYQKYMKDIVECEDADERKEMLASAECAFANMMSCVAETLGMGAVLSMQGSVFEGVDRILGSWSNRRRITYAQQELDALMVEILRATATRGTEGSIIRTRMKSVRDKAIDAMNSYPAVFSVLNLFNPETDVDSNVASIKEFSDLRAAFESDINLDEATIDELADRLMNDAEAYKDARRLDSYFDM